MKRQTIAEVARKYCIDNGYDGVAYGDVYLLDEIGRLANMKACHPLNRHQRILRALERRPDLFKKRYFRLKGLARYFTLI